MDNEEKMDKFQGMQKLPRLNQEKAEILIEQLPAMKLK